MKTNDFVLIGLVVFAVAAGYRGHQLSRQVDALRGQLEDLRGRSSRGGVAGGESAAELCAKLNFGRWEEKSNRCVLPTDDHDHIERLERSLASLQARLPIATTTATVVADATRAPAQMDGPRTAKPLGPLAPGINRDQLYYVSELLPKDQVGWGAQIITKAGFHECYNPQGAGYCKPRGGRQSDFHCRSGEAQDFALTQSKRGHPAYMKACLPTR